MKSDPPLSVPSWLRRSTARLNHIMAIVPLNKLTIYGMSDQKADVLDGLQRLGCLHLIGLRSVHRWKA